MRLAEPGDLVTSAPTPEHAVEEVKRGQVVNCPSEAFGVSVLAHLGLNERTIAERFRVAYGGTLKAGDEQEDG